MPARRKPQPDPKQCRACGVSKALSEFHTNYGTPKTTCKACEQQRMRERRQQLKAEGKVVTASFEIRSDLYGELAMYAERRRLTLKQAFTEAARLLVERERAREAMQWRRVYPAGTDF